MSAHGDSKMPVTAVAEVALEDLPVSEDGVRLCWKQFAMDLPKEQAAMAGRLMNIRPSLNDLTVKVSIDNRMVAEELSAICPQLEAHLRRQLQNGKLTIHVVVEENTAAHKIYSRVEQYQILEKRNPSLRKLKELLDLDLS
jgi:DNA polymerase-3 subunit gamma/tau